MAVTADKTQFQPVEELGEGYEIKEGYEITDEVLEGISGGWCVTDCGDLCATDH